MFYKNIRYQTIASVVAERIQSGYYKTTSPLPSQKFLSEEFGCSLMTMRKAIEMLEYQGIVRSKHGVGVFIETNYPKRNFMVSSFTNMMTQSHIAVTTKVVEKKFNIKNDSMIKDIFKNKKELLGCISRVRYYNNKPIILQHSYMPMRYKSVIQKYEDNMSLYNLFFQETHIIISEAREIVDMRYLSSEDAKKIDAVEGISAMHAIRMNLDIKGDEVLLDDVFLVGQNIVLMNHMAGMYQASNYGILDDGTNYYEKLQDKHCWEKNLP